MLQLAFWMLSSFWMVAEAAPGKCQIDSDDTVCYATGAPSSALAFGARYRGFRPKFLRVARTPIPPLDAFPDAVFEIKKQKILRNNSALITVKLKDAPAVEFIYLEAFKCVVSRARRASFPISSCRDLCSPYSTSCAANEQRYECLVAPNVRTRNGIRGIQFCYEPSSGTTTTSSPTTSSPVTESPSTLSPSTLAPTTFTPTTIAPSTASPLVPVTVNGATVTLDSAFLGDEGCTARSKLVLWNLYTQQVDGVVCDDLTFIPPGPEDPPLAENPCDRPFCYPEPGPEPFTFTGNCIATDLVTLDFACPGTPIGSSGGGAVTPQGYYGGGEGGGSSSVLLPHGEAMHTAPHPFRANESMVFYTYTHVTSHSRRINEGAVHTLGSSVLCTSVNPFACLAAGGGGIFG